MKCLVCEQPACRRFACVDTRWYWRCDACEATFLDPASHPSREQELAEYLLHQNHPADAGYRHYLQPLIQPLLQHLSPASRGLDYGCGPGSALAAVLREAGHDVVLYDPFFHCDRTPLDDRYDFVVCAEVVEHFHRPHEEFSKLDKLLRPGGVLGLMTRFLTDQTDFAQWHYRRDPTHVVFYREPTLRQMAQRFGWRCEIPCVNVALLTKPR